MPVQRLNHIVLYVSDARRTAKFYTDVLDFETLTEIANGKAIFMRAPGSTNDHDLGLFELGPDARPSRLGGRPSACTTWPGRSTPLPSWSGSPLCCPTGAPSSALRTTAPRRPSTQSIRTASSSRSLGCSRPIPSPIPIVRCRIRCRSTSGKKRRASAPTPPAASGCRHQRESTVARRRLAGQAVGAWCVSIRGTVKQSGKQ